MARPAIRITLIDRLGKRGCHRVLLHSPVWKQVILATPIVSA